MEDILIVLFESLIKAVIILSLILTAAAVLVYVERKMSAWIQNRIGPNRVGPFGILQPFADVFKLFLKEDLVPKDANKLFHRIAPIISIGVAISVYSVIPFADSFTFNDKVYYMGIAPEVNIGVLFILALTSVGVYGITIAGWSSNNKYSLLGAMRSSAQMISYELSMGLAIIAIIMISGSLSLTNIVEHQAGWKWNLILQPLGFIIFLTTAFAEANRAPFDLPEAEPELVAGFNTEYSGMKFGMFFLAEYGNMATSSAIITLLYLGGWYLPFISYQDLGFQSSSIILSFVQFIVFLAKIFIVCLFFIWVRWSIPRFRYDQLMNLGWKVLLPLALINVVLTGIALYFFK